MTQKLELETSVGKSFQSWKDQAAKAGLALRMPNQLDSGDIPEKIWSQLRRFRRNLAISQDHIKIVTSIVRQLVTVRDEKGRPTKKEYLTYSGYWKGTTKRGLEYHADAEWGKYKKPKIVANGNLKYSPDTGEPIGNDKALGTPETIYEIEVPKTKEGRKKLIDSILGEDTYPDNVTYYYKDLVGGFRDNTFTYEDFVNCTIEELKDMHDRSGGSKGANYYRDSNGNLRDKSGSIVSRGN